LGFNQKPDPLEQQNDQANWCSSSMSLWGLASQEDMAESYFK